MHTMPAPNRPKTARVTLNPIKHGKVYNYEIGEVEFSDNKGGWEKAKREDLPAEFKAMGSVQIHLGLMNPSWCLVDNIYYWCPK